MDQPQKPRERALDDAVSRALRDNLPSLQHTAEELQEAFADLIAACGSAKSANALPAMLRARTAAGALSARLEILSHFITEALQPRARPLEETILLRSIPALDHPAEPEFPPPSIATPMASSVETVEESAPPAIESVPVLHAVDWAETAEIVSEPEPGLAPIEEPLHQPVHAAEESVEEEPAVEELVAEEPAIFDVANLSLEQRELHRRANRLAKVAMQDIQMLRPEDVRLGREHKDLCARLRSDLDKARKEYDRRFHSIQDHPVDYFHHWMVAILASGEADALGEYPYPSPVLRH